MNMIMTKHSRRTVSLAHNFTQYLNYDDETISTISMGAAFHDIGKFYIPDEIWNLPRRLSDNEFKLVKRHPKIGHEVLNYITDNDIMLNMCLYHHERWDGTGYPEGLKGEMIPKEARIMSLCDVYEALTSERHYKSEIEVSDALGIIELKLGNHFDPILGEKFIYFIRAEQRKQLNKINTVKSLII